MRWFDWGWKTKVAPFGIRGFAAAVKLGHLDSLPCGFSLHMISRSLCLSLQVASIWVPRLKMEATNLKVGLKNFTPATLYW